MDKLFNDVAFKISRLVTREYSTSFSKAVSSLEKEQQQGIFSIYGFVRFADEIVDTFQGVDRKQLLEKFEKDYYRASDTGVSTNPILHSFHQTVRKYAIPDELVQAFLGSMKYDLYRSSYPGREDFNRYIYGSADVVGLMCLKVFVNGDETIFGKLKEPAMRLGSAFQKVNFLRDIKNDTEILQRRYFPELAEQVLTDGIKDAIVADIRRDFDASYGDIKFLPGRSRLAVTIAFLYYKTLLEKIHHTPAEVIMTSRLRISCLRKSLLYVKAYLIYWLKSA